MKHRRAVSCPRSRGYLRSHADETLPDSLTSEPKTCHFRQKGSRSEGRSAHQKGMSVSLLNTQQSEMNFIRLYVNYWVVKLSGLALDKHSVYLYLHL